MTSTITPSRFMFAGKEYVKHNHFPTVDCWLACGRCDLGDVPCEDAPPCDRKHNQGVQVYFKLEQPK